VFIIDWIDAKWTYNALSNQKELINIIAIRLFDIKSLDCDKSDQLKKSYKQRRVIASSNFPKINNSLRIKPR